MQFVAHGVPPLGRITIPVSIQGAPTFMMLCSAKSAALPPLAAGLDPHEWTPRELRHSFVSLLSDGVPIEQISRLVGHSGTTTTETIYRCTGLARPLGGLISAGAGRPVRQLRAVGRVPIG